MTDTTEQIVVNLDEQHFAPIGRSSLIEIIMARAKWPTGATCATQESDGEVLYWDAPVELVIEGRKTAAEHGMIAEVGFRYQIDSWYQSDEPLLAFDWNSSVVTAADFNRK